MLRVYPKLAHRQREPAPTSNQHALLLSSLSLYCCSSPSLPMQPNPAAARAKKNAGGRPHRFSLRGSDSASSGRGKISELWPLPERTKPCSEHNEENFFTHERNPWGATVPHPVIRPRLGSNPGGWPPRRECPPLH